MLELIQQVASKVINPRFGRLAGGEIVEKNPGDLVTVADREAEVLLTREIMARHPKALVVGEEASFSQPELITALADADHAFTVDPVDGTRNFTNASPDHAVMVAEVVKGECVRSWIWQPQHRLAFVAERGAGVLLNGEPLRPIERDRLPLGGSSRRELLGRDGGGAIQPIVRSRWCCGVDYPLVATGELDFLCYWNMKPWDHMPCALLLRELGGEVITRDGQRYRAGSTGPGLIAAATPEIAETVRRVWS